MRQPLSECSVEQLCRATRKLQCSLPQLVVHASSVTGERLDVPRTIERLERFKRYETVPPAYPGAPERVFLGWEAGIIYGPVAAVVQATLESS